MVIASLPVIPAKQQQFKDKQKPDDVRTSNIAAAKAVADSIRTSLGPKGMDKMIQTGRNGENVIVTNDGATILKYISVLHPTAKMLVDLSAAQDIEAGDGTTSVVIIAGSLLSVAEKLLAKGLHPTTISQAFQKAAAKAVEILNDISQKVSLDDHDLLCKVASTALSSKIVSQHSSLLAPIAVEAVIAAKESNIENNVDLNNIRIVKKVGGTIEDTHLVHGLVLNQEVVKSAGGPTSMEKAKIALVQFHLSPPKPDIENQIIVNDSEQIDRILKEERDYLLNICDKIKKTGCNVLLIQKSILRDAVTDVSLSFLKKLKILVVRDIEREEVEFICNSIGTKPIADIESFTEDKLAYADLVEETVSAGEKVVKITGVKHPKKCMCILMHGSSSLVLDEAARSLHDALCVIRCIVKNNAIIAGCGAPEIEISQKLRVYSRSLSGMEAYCFQAFADAIEMIPITLVENSGLDPIDIISQLKTLHSNGKKNAGIDVKTGKIVDNSSEYVIQPLLVSTSCVELAAETVKMILKIDDIVTVR